MNDETRSARVAVVGAGATGGYLAARLSLAGVPTAVVARGESLDAIRSRGIEITEPDGTRLVATPAEVLDVAEVDASFTHVLLCVKTYDTDAAANLLGRLMGDDGKVLCLQNGVKSEQLLGEAFGRDRVLSGVLYIGSQRVAPGVIRCTSPPRMLIGPYGRPDTASCETIAGMMREAAIECRIEPEISAAKWQKFLFNCALNPLTAVTGQRLGALLELPETARVFFDLLDEAIAVARPEGAPLPQDVAGRVAETAARMDISSSMAEDLEAGRRIELDAFTGYVVELGRRHGVPTPVTDVLHALLIGLEAGRRVGSGGQRAEAS